MCEKVYVVEAVYRIRVNDDKYHERARGIAGIFSEKDKAREYAESEMERLIGTINSEILENFGGELSNEELERAMWDAARCSWYTFTTGVSLYCVMKAGEMREYIEYIVTPIEVR